MPDNTSAYSSGLLNRLSRLMVFSVFLFVLIFIMFVFLIFVSSCLIDTFKHLRPAEQRDTDITAYFEILTGQLHFTVISLSTFGVIDLSACVVAVVINK